eukprot:1781067-Amphidinium_carterae.1
MSGYRAARVEWLVPYLWYLTSHMQARFRKKPSRVIISCSVSIVGAGFDWLLWLDMGRVVDTYLWQWVQILAENRPEF